MTQLDRDLTALLGSRICHDLISPLGAIGNGLELLQLSGLGDSPEFDLINDSVKNANQRIRMFRIAFGGAQDGQVVSASEIQAIIGTPEPGRKLQVTWTAEGAQSRLDAKLVFLTLQCFESAMPWGGHITIGKEDDHWRIYGEADRLNVDSTHWAMIDSAQMDPDISAGHVHFALCAAELARQARSATSVIADHSISVEF